MARKRKQSRLGEWEETLRLLPGFDPFRCTGGAEFDREHAEFVIRFIESCCRHSKGSKGGKLLVLEPFQKAFVANIFGWKMPDGTRRFRESLGYIPRKNGKTLLLAAIMLAVLILDREPGCEIYSAAADKAQAKLVFAAVKGMIEQDKGLKKRLKTFQNHVEYSAERGVYVCLSSEAPTKHGLNAQMVCFDELHAQPDRELYDVLSTSMGARAQPLFLAITTSDFDRPSICNEKHEYASRVRDGLVDDWAFLPAIWEAPVDADWKEPGVWAACNPNLGVSISWEFLRREFSKAIESAAFENTFRRLYLNQKTRTDTRWLSLEDWDACEVFTESELHGESCWAGLDLSSTRDLVALSLVFPLDEDVFAIIPRFWVPEESAEVRSRRDKVEYLAWIRAGWILGTKGKATDYRRIREDVHKLGDQFGIKQIAIDRLFQGEETSQALEGMGFDVVPWGQGFLSMAAPTKRFEELLTAHKIIHNGNPVLRWQVGHVTAEQDSSGNLKPSKKISREKIDGIVASVMALGLCCQRGTTRSVYEDRGLLELEG